VETERDLTVNQSRKRSKRGGGKHTRKRPRLKRIERKNGTAETIAEARLRIDQGQQNFSQLKGGENERNASRADKKKQKRDEKKIGGLYFKVRKTPHAHAQKTQTGSEKNEETACGEMRSTPMGELLRKSEEELREKPQKRRGLTSISRKAKEGGDQDNEEAYWEDWPKGTRKLFK